MSTFRLVLALAFIVSGSISILLSILGVFKFHFVMNRMHCAAIIDTLGLSMLFAGLVTLAPDMTYVTKLILVLLIQWVGSPIASHMVGRLETETEDDLQSHMAMEDDT